MTQFRQLFRSGVGCFLPEVVSELPFISKPDTSTLKQSVFSGRMKAMALEQITDWLAQGIVREVQYTPKAVTPILMVPKPRSSAYRLCLDFRLVNSCCRHVYSPPIDRHALLRDLPKRKVFSTVDISSAFTCVRIAEHLQTYFGIELDGRFYVFKRLPFGFHNSMHLFLRAIRFTVAKVRPLLPRDVTLVSYVDDLCIASDSVESHRTALRLLFKYLQEDGWTINMDKCKLFKSDVLFLGVRYSAQGVSPDPALLTKLSSLPLPSTAGDLRTLFGISLCLQQFNYRLWHLLAPLRRYARAKPATLRTDEFQQCWRSCITALQDNLWRSTPLDLTSGSPMSIYVDSSSEAHGAALFQGRNLISMWSAINQRPHASSAESEITGLCKALQAFRPYIAGIPVTVMTDNKAVLSALNPDNQSDVVKRHLDTVQFWFGNQVCIKHIAGAANKLADLLSRSRYLTMRDNGNLAVVERATQCMPVQRRPSQMDVKRRLDSAHFGHWGFKTTLQNALLENSRWPGIEADVRNFIAQCPNCAFSADPQVRDLPSTDISRHMGDRVHMDHAGPYFDGTHVLLLVDNATKYVMTVWTPGTGTGHALQALNAWIERFGPIRLLCVDNASAWNSEQFIEWTARRGIEVRRSPSYYHKGNALAERTIQTLQHRIRRILNGSARNWPGAIPAATDAINTSWHSAIQTTPRTLAQGLDRNGVLMDAEELQLAWERAWRRQTALKEYEKRRFVWKHPMRSAALRVGDTVLVKDHLHLSHPLKKLGPTWKGPFVIVRQNSNSTWVLRKPTRGGAPFLSHSSEMRPFRIVQED